MILTNGKTEIIGGWAGDALDKAGSWLGDKAFDGFITLIGWIGSVTLYVSIAIVAFGVYCLIFQYKKPLKVGLFIFIISMVLVMIGGINL